MKRQSYLVFLRQEKSKIKLYTYTNKGKSYPYSSDRQNNRYKNGNN